MADIKVNSEQELMEILLQSAAYKDFMSHYLPAKLDREQLAAGLLREHRGNYTQDVLNRIFDTVDIVEGNKRWFGQMLAAPNRNLIFTSGLDEINKWLEELLFSGWEPVAALNTCLKDLKIKGASKGLATLLMYLLQPEKCAVWVNTTQEGLQVLGYANEMKGSDWGRNYAIFNQAAQEFRARYGLQPQEVDWVLTFISSYVESEDGHLRVSEDTLETEEVAVNVKDEDDLDDVVGQPMELGVMRWTPTNEMGVVALFIEYRRQLGFPIVEIIRTNFPDAVVFQECAKGYVRRYIEFEYRSSGFKSHLKSKRRCHYVVCWEHDWKDCPLPVIELRQQIPTIMAK